MIPREPIEERITRVRAILVAARRLVDPNDPLGKEARRLLPAATALSEASVELGLARHVETDASDDDLARLVSRAGSEQRVHVLLSANVFVGVVRAVALAVAASPSVSVRPSSREAVMAPLLLRALAETASATTFEICDAIDPVSGDVIHVYGRSETIDAVTRESPPGVRVVGHGPGFALALVEARSDRLEHAAERLSWDVVAFDQRGCMSPRIVLVHGSPAEVETFADCLAIEMEARERDVPRGALTEDERRARALYCQTATAIGRCRAASAFAVGIDTTPRALPLPPSGRHVHVARIAGPDDVATLLGPFRDAVTAVGHQRASALATAVLAFLRGARSLGLGAMQSPPLDGPVDLRGML